MLDFKKPQLEDREWVRELLCSSGPVTSDMAFGTAYLWRDIYEIAYARYQDTLIIRSESAEILRYNFPKIQNDLRGLVEAVKKDAQEQNKEAVLWGITPGKMERFEAELPDVFTFEPNRGSFDYVYLASDLADLPGSRYHSKRNHLRRFRRTYPDYSYEDVTHANLGDCYEVAKQWCIQNGCDDELKDEKCVILRAVKGYDALCLMGGLIRIQGKPVAFTIAEEINADTIDTHFEKALAGYNGLYTAINQEFASRVTGKYKYINREEDLGIEGLRRAKLSYHPAYILEKYTAIPKEGVLDV